MEALRISQTALDVEWRRLELIAQNLANINSTQDDEGRVYQPQTLLSGPMEAFGTALGALRAAEPRGVQVVRVETESATPRRVYEPDHPQADADGFVSYANVDHAEQMMALLKSARVYEANLAVMSLAQQMYRQAVEAGR